MADPPALDRRTWLVALAGGVAALVVLRLWQGEAYWQFAEGVYALTARLFIHGASLYRTTFVAQPPGVILFGAGVLSIHDSLEFLRVGVGLVQLAAGLISVVVVYRLSGSRAAAAVAPALTLLTPWAVHEHGMLAPEPLALPLLLGGALLASRERTVALGGAVAALAIGVKLPYVLPVLGIVVMASDRRRAGIAAVSTVAVMAVAGLALFGTDLVRDTLVAQSQSGHHRLGALPGDWAQVAWNLLGLAVAALVLVRARPRDPALSRVWLGLIGGLVLTLLTIYKNGTDLNVTLPVEAALVPVALAGAAASRRIGIPAIAFVLAQTIALMALPVRTAFPFVQPLSVRGAWARDDTTQHVRALAAAARTCPPGVAYPGFPFIAFLAHRPPPGGQPDQFLVPLAPTLSRERRAMQADPRRCPADAPGP